MSKPTLPGDPAGKIVVFQERSIRRAWLLLRIEN